jgi:hypothetical protein
MPATCRRTRHPLANHSSLEEPLPNTTLRRPALNIPLLALWLVTIGAAAVGFWMLQAGNAAQAEFYTSGGDDYLLYLNLQTQSTIGGFLLIAGVVGVLLALATHARNRSAAVLAANAVASDDTAVGASDDLDDDGFDDVDNGSDEPDAADAHGAHEPSESVETTSESEPAPVPEPSRS